MHCIISRRAAANSPKDPCKPAVFTNENKLIDKLMER